ncbi:MAG TPA: ABC transporter permease [Longimicrobiales bacterium]
MSAWHPVLEVALWEFRRYIKPKQQVVGAVITLAMMMGGAGLARLGGDEGSTIELAVIGADALDVPAELDRFRFERYDATALDRLRREVEQRERDAVLIVRGDGTGELIVRQTPGWPADLARTLTALAVQRRLEASGLDLERLAAIQAPFDLAVHEAAPRAGRSEWFAAFVALFLSLMGLFTGMGYIFISVTGEKRNRLSEQVISAISPQAWIDGKIIGLSGVSIVGILNLIVCGLVFLVLSRVLWDSSVPLPSRVERPDLLLAALVFIFLGFLFWFAFVTAVAAIIDDPHNSNRNQLMLLPIAAMVPAFVAVMTDPAATWVRVLALLPPTSAGVLPARLLVTDVPWWEGVLAAVLLIAAIALVRRSAGRVFRLGMLMYGKEPSWSEVRRWLREAR